MESELKPMLCGRADVVPEGDQWILEAKLDGWRGIAHTTGRGVLLYARSGSDYSGKLPYVESELAAMLPPDTAVDGELIGDGWGDVQGVMTRGNGPHVPSKGIPALTYVIFDVTRINGQDVRSLPFDDRRALLEAAKFADYEHLSLSQLYPATARALQVAISLGFEGVVTKRRDSRYVNGRSNLWIKVKPKASTTDEAIVRGFKDGTGSLTGKVGAFEIEMLDEHGTPNGVLTRVKCGTQERHDDATANPNRWLGTIIEISHHGLGKTGKPRHPQFERRRDDQAAPAKKPVQAPATSRPRRKATMRNYGAMGDSKLLRCIAELEAGPGNEAYDRAADTGSGDPGADLDKARAIAAERGL